MTVKICRVCFEEGDHLESLGSGDGSYGHKLASCVPEIDVYIVCNPNICSSCISMVEVAYGLRDTCIQNEIKFKCIKGNAKENCNVQMALNSPEITNNRVMSEEIITKNESNICEDDICVSVIFNDCLNESSVSLLTSKNEISLNENLCSSSADYLMNNDSERSEEKGAQNVLNSTSLSMNKELDETRFEEKLIISQNVMCADLNNFEENMRNMPTNAATNIQIFSDVEERFELDLNSVRIFNEVSSPERTCAGEADLNKIRKLISCVICKEMHDETYINAHMKTHDIRSTYDCGRCDKTFSDTCELETHILTHLKNLCDVCGNVFISKNDLLEHKRTHVTKCCGEELSTGSLLQLHTYQKHGKTCGICKKTWDSFNGIFLHLLEHTGDDKLRCPKCRKMFANDTLKFNHLCKPNGSDRVGEEAGEAAVKRELKKFQCKCCFTQFKKRKTYWLHRRRNNVKCDRCDSSFTSKCELHKHFSAAHNSVQHFTNVKSKVSEISTTALGHNCGAHEQNDDVKTDSRICQLCPSKFQSGSLLTQHILKNHCYKAVRIKLIDFQKYSSDLNLRRGDLSQHPEAPVRLYCYACQEVYMNQGLYQKHMKIFHSKCTICKIRLNDLRNIVKHVRQHFKNKKDPLKNSQKTQRQNLPMQLLVRKVKPYCELCQKEYENNVLYRTHMTKCHKKGYPLNKLFCKRPKLKKTYLCMHCNTTFTLTSDLQRHLKLCHSYPRTYIKCKICGETFRNTMFLMNHIFTVHSRCTIESVGDIGNATMRNDLPALNTSCYMCGENFDTINKLKAHVLVHI